MMGRWIEDGDGLNDDAGSVVNGCFIVDDGPLTVDGVGMDEGR